MEQEPTTKIPNDFINGVLALAIGHGIAAILIFAYGMISGVLSNSLIGAVFLTLCLGVPCAQSLYAIPLIIYFVIKKRLMAMAGVLTAFGLTWLLAFGICFAGVFLGQNLNF